MWYGELDYKGRFNRSRKGWFWIDKEGEALLPTTIVHLMPSDALRVSSERKTSTSADLSHLYSERVKL